MQEINEKKGSEKISTGRLTLLQLMAFLGTLGIVATAILRYFFP